MALVDGFGEAVGVVEGVAAGVVGDLVHGGVLGGGLLELKSGDLWPSGLGLPA